MAAGGDRLEQMIADRARLRWFRRGPITVTVACSNTTHRVWCDGDRVELLDHAADDDERVLELLGGTSPFECLLIQRAWRDARSRALPRPLAAMARARWRAAGIADVAIDEFEAGLDQQWPAPAVRVGGLHPRLDAALWREVIGDRPTPENLRPYAALGIDLSELAAWAEAFERRVSVDAIAAARLAGVTDGYEARGWVGATGRMPGAAELREWREAGVTGAFGALAWAELHGGVVSPAVVRRYREQGITDPEASLDAR